MLKKMISDRRKNPDRRVVKRYSVNIDIEWKGLIGRQQGTISDISSLGCFVMCSGEVEDGETVKLYLPISDGMKAEIWGEVVNHVYEIGFGLRFIELTKPQKEILEKLVKKVSD